VKRAEKKIPSNAGRNRLLGGRESDRNAQKKNKNECRSAAGKGLVEVTKVIFHAWGKPRKKRVKKTGGRAGGGGPQTKKKAN